MTYTHAPTALKGVDPNSDRDVIFNGDTIGRVMQIEPGPKQGRWSYFGQWTGGCHISGTLDTMELALARLKELHTETGQPPSVASRAPKARFDLKWSHGPGED
jgi:hypothetical protein